MQLDTSFPKHKRLRKKFQFVRIVRFGKKYVGEYLIFEVLPNQMRSMRLGLTVSRKFGKSVKRNRFKRVLREVFRVNCLDGTKGFDIHIKPRGKAKEATYAQIQEEFIRLQSEVEFF